jgi:transposase
MNHVIAFDVSMGKSAMVIYDRHQHCVWEGEVTHTPAGFRFLKNQIEAVTHQDGREPHLVFEATGVYSEGLQAFLKEHGYAYSRLNPLEAKLQTASLRRHKTDVRDAHDLAKSHFRVDREKTYIQEDYYEQMRALGRYYEETDKELCRQDNRLHAFLQLSFPTFETVFSKNTELFYGMVQCYPHSALLADVSNDELCRQIKQATRKRLSSRQLEESAEALRAAGAASYPAIHPDDVRCRHMTQYAGRILELKRHKKEIIRQMVERSRDRVEFQVFQSFPGIGETTAVRLVGELGDIRRFQNAKQINAYIGIDVHRHQSGKLHHPDRINKRGNKRLRRILYFMIMGMLSHRRRTNNTIVEYYDHLKKQPNGKLHPVAVIACVNKFLKVAFHLIRHGLLYQYEVGRTS